MMGVGTPVAAQVKLTVCPGTACTDSRGGVTTCGGTAGRASPPAPGTPPAPRLRGPRRPGTVPRRRVPRPAQGTRRSMAPRWVARHRDRSMARLGHGVPSPGTPAPLGWQCPQPGTAWAQGPQPHLRDAASQHGTQHGATSASPAVPQLGRSVPSTGSQPCPAAQRPHHRAPQLGRSVPNTVPRHGAPSPSPVSPCPRVPLTAANLVGAVGAVGLLVAVVAGGDAGPAGHAAELVRPARRAGRLGGCNGPQPSAGAMSPHVPTAPTTLTAVGLIRAVPAVVVPIAAPQLQGAVPVAALELVGLAGRRGAWGGGGRMSAPTPGCHRRRPPGNSPQSSSSLPSAQSRSPSQR